MYAKSKQSRRPTAPVLSHGEDVQPNEALNKRSQTGPPTIKSSAPQRPRDSGWATAGQRKNGKAKPPGKGKGRGRGRGGGGYHPRGFRGNHVTQGANAIPLPSPPVSPGVRSPSLVNPGASGSDQRVNGNQSLISRGESSFVPQRTCSPNRTNRSSPITSASHPGPPLNRSISGESSSSGSRTGSSAVSHISRDMPLPTANAIRQLLKSVRSSPSTNGASGNGNAPKRNATSLNCETSSAPAEAPERPFKRRKIDEQGHDQLRAEPPVLQPTQSPQAKPQLHPPPAHQASTSTAATTHPPIQVKRELSPSPALSLLEPRRFLVNSGSKRFAPLPINCQKMDPGWKRNREAWAKREKAWLESFSLKVERMFVREDGMVIDWKTIDGIPVWSDTFLPQPEGEDGATQFPHENNDPASVINKTGNYNGNTEKPQGQEKVKAKEKLPKKAKKPRIGPLSDGEKGHEIIILDDEPEAESRGEDRRDRAQRRAASKSAASSASDIVEVERPSVEVIESRSTSTRQNERSTSAVSERDGPTAPSIPDKVTRQSRKDATDERLSLEQERPIRLSRDPSSENEVRFWETADLPTLDEADEAVDMAIDFLTRYITQFHADRSALSSAYARSATFSYRVDRFMSDGLGAPVSKENQIASDTSGLKQGRLDVIMSLLSLPEPEFTLVDPTPIEYDVAYLGEEQGTLLICYAEPEDEVRVEMRFVLRKREWDEEDRLTDGLWPLVAVSHQISVREC